MHNEQVFTPEHIVRYMLDMAGYQKRADIRGKYVLDNSCGDGNILVEVFRRYIDTCLSDGVDIKNAVTEACKCIWGVEIDAELRVKAWERIVALFRSYGYDTELPKINIMCRDSLDMKMRFLFRGRFDFVFGNPPYCKIQHLSEKYDVVKGMKFTSNGNTDVYLAFFEIGIESLNLNGQLVYITPSAWMTNKAGKAFRLWLCNKQCLEAVVGFGGEKMFEEATTFTAITHLKMNKTDDTLYFKEGFEGEWQQQKLSDVLFPDGSGLFFASVEELNKFWDIRRFNLEEYCIFDVKNGFATLNDKLFLTEEEDNPDVIEVVKASTAQRHRMYYPYTQEGKPKQYSQLKDKTREHFTEQNYLYGRTQALADVWRNQLAVTSIIKTVDDVKTEFACIGSGVYGGLYVISDDDRCLPLVEDMMRDDDFMRYIKLLAHYKNGGYYTFTSKELKQYLNWKYYMSCTTDQNRQ